MSARQVSNRCSGCTAVCNGQWYLCSQCSGLIVAMLIALYRRDVRHGRPMPNLLDELTITVTRQSRMTEKIGSRVSAVTPLVFNDLAARRLRALAAFLRDEAHHYRLDAAPGAFPAEVRRVNNPYAHAAYLHYVMADITNSADSGTFKARLTQLIDDATSVIDRPADQWFAGPCQCGADLYATENAVAVRCRECRATVDVSAQRERLLSAVDDALVTATEISRAVHLTGTPVTPSKITNLYHRGAFTRHGRSRAGDHLYRMGDVMAALTTQQTAQRRGRTK